MSVPIPASPDSINEFVAAHLPSKPPHVRADKIVHDSIWGTVSIRRHEVALLDTPLMQRLRRIHQTSFAYLTYPSAVHTRFEHSLGCLYLASRFISALHDKDAGGGLVTGDVEQNIRAAALLHDVGHGPFSHSSEEVYNKLPQYKEMHAQFPMLRDAKAHEFLTALILNSAPFREYIAKINRDYGRALDVDRMIGAICGVSAPDRQFEVDILNGPFDVDKVDYTMRDSRLIGLPVGVDLHRLFTAVDINTDTSGERKLVLDLSGEITLEQIVFGKMVLFASVYQHHKARACDCMLKAVFDAAKEVGIPFKGRKMESPVDFLWWTDDMLSEQGCECKADSKTLHDLMHGIAYRRLIRRALCISKDFVKDRKARRYDDFMELRMNKPQHQTELREVADKIWKMAGEPCDRGFIWVDLPRPPSLTEGKETRIRKPNGDLCPLDDIFQLDQWTEHYDQHKWMGHVFGPQDHLDEISKAARMVFQEEYGIELHPTAWQLCHVNG